MATLIDAGDTTLARAGQQFAPDVTALAGGGYALAWVVGDNSDITQARSTVHVQVYDAAGNAVGAEQVIAAATQTATAVRLAPLASGGFMAFWAAETYNGPYYAVGVDFYAQAFDASGNAVSGAAKVNDTPMYGTDFMQPIALASGGVALNFGTDQHVQLFDAAGHASGGDISTLRLPDGSLRAGDEDFASGTRIAGDGQGGFWAVWDGHTTAASVNPSTYRLDLAHFDASGNLVPISNAFTTQGPQMLFTLGIGDAVQPAIAALANGNFVIAYPFNTDSGKGISVWMYDADANNFFHWNVPQQPGSTGYVADMKVTPVADGSFVVSWAGTVDSSTYPIHIYEQQFDSGGHPIGDVQQAGQAPVNETSQYNFFGATGLADGSVLYSWWNGEQDAGNLVIDRVNSTGTGGGGGDTGGGNAPFTASSSHVVAATADDERGASAAVLPGGGHVTTWTSGSDTDQHAWAQFFDAQGNATTGPIELFTGLSSLNGVRGGGAGALADGTVVVTGSTVFQSAPGVTPDMQAYAERIDATGRVLDGPDLIASKSVADEAGFGAGGVLVAPDGSYAVELVTLGRPFPPIGPTTTLSIQRYTASGEKTGGVVDVTSGLQLAAPNAAVLTNGNIISVATDLASLFTTSLAITVSDGSGDQLSTRTLGDGYDSGGQVQALANGNAFIAWGHGSALLPSSWQGMVVDGAGNQVGSTIELAAPADAGIRLVALGGGLLVWWNGSSGSMAQYISDSGQPIGDAFSIGSNVGSITATPDGGFLVDRVAPGANGDHDVTEQLYALASQSGPAPGGTIDVSGHAGATPIPSGNFVISGGGGIDTISFASAHTAYSITPTSIAGPEGIDTLAGIERIQFSDGMAIAFDVNGDAGEAYRLYQAAFSRAPDLPGLGFHIRDLDNGVPLWGVAEHFVESPEFQSRYGSAVDDTQFITLLYENVLHREPEQAGLDFHLNEFAQGESRADMLTHFSESPENQANVIGQIANGMWFVPLA